MYSFIMYGLGVGYCGRSLGLSPGCRRGAVVVFPWGAAGLRRCSFGPRLWRSWVLGSPWAPMFAPIPGALISPFCEL